MIKLPKEVNKILKTVTDAGAEIYAVGQCVRDGVMGEKSLDFDLAADMSMEELKRLFPQGTVMKGAQQVLRLDFTQQGNEEAPIADIIALPQDQSITDFLKEAKFTVNAMADNASIGFLDPYGGKEAIQKKLLLPTEPAEVLFQRDPLSMMEIIKLAAHLDFDLPKAVYEEIVSNAQGLKTIDKDVIRRELEEIIIAPYAGKGLRMLAGTELMPAIVGDVALHMSTRQRGLFSQLTEGIDQLKKVKNRRLGLFYLCFEKNGQSAVDYLNYDDKTRQQFTDALRLMEKIFFLNNKIELKQFLVEYGPDRYDYIHNLAKAQTIVYQNGDIKIKNRHYMMKEIIDNGEPVYVEDLVIEAEDLIEEGIATAENAGQLLLMLTDVVHKKPSLNTREKLLEQAKKFTKNKLAAKFRRVKWIK